MVLVRISPLLNERREGRRSEQALFAMHNVMMAAFQTHFRITLLADYIWFKPSPLPSLLFPLSSSLLLQPVMNVTTVSHKYCEMYVYVGGDGRVMHQPSQVVALHAGRSSRHPAAALFHKYEVECASAVLWHVWICIKLVTH